VTSPRRRRGGEEVLYCTDTAAIGFVWKQGAEKPTQFEPKRYTIKLVADNERVVIPMTGDTAGSPRRYKCHATYQGSRRGSIAFDDGYGDVPWVFHQGSYTRAFLAGPPVGSSDQNIIIAYGTCAKF
jgi:hypothetical protein